jgi:hypothetical protein
LPSLILICARVSSLPSSSPFAQPWSLPPRRLAPFPDARSSCATSLPAPTRVRTRPHGAGRVPARSSPCRARPHDAQPEFRSMLLLPPHMPRPARLLRCWPLLQVFIPAMARPSSSIARTLLFSIAARARPWSFLAARPAPLPQLVLLPSIAALLPCRAPLSYFPARRRALSSPAATPARGFLVPFFSRARSSSNFLCPAGFLYAEALLDRASLGSSSPSKLSCRARLSCLPNSWSRSRLAAVVAPTAAHGLLPCARSASSPSSSLRAEVARSSLSSSVFPARPVCAPRSFVVVFCFFVACAAFRCPSSCRVLLCTQSHPVSCLPVRPLSSLL